MSEPNVPGEAPRPGPYQNAFALLAELIQAFADTSDVEMTLERALEAVADLVGAEGGSLWILEEGGEVLTCRAGVGPIPIVGARVPLAEGIVGKTVRQNMCQRVLDVTSDPNFSPRLDHETGLVTRSILCSPLRFGDHAIGAIELLNKRGVDARFDPDDAILLQVLASSAGLAVANARLTAAQMEHDRVRRELGIAAEIQRSLLPAPRPAPFPVCGVNRPARTVSGDLYDILELSGDRVAFCLGDVSGKGMNASLLMAKTASLYRCLAKEDLGPGELLARLNTEIHETATRGMFVTMVTGIYDAATGCVEIANAGHEPPLLHAADGSFRPLPAERPPIGILADGEFPELRVELGEGALYVFSDGLTEASDVRGEELGSQGVQRLIERFTGKPLAERVDAIVSCVSEGRVRDDLTLLCVSAGGS